MVMVREEGDPSPEGIEYRHGLTPPMRDARRRRFRREPDLNVLYFIFSFHLHHYHDYLVAKSYFHLQPELVQRVEKDLLNIMSGGTVENILKSLNS